MNDELILSHEGFNPKYNNKAIVQSIKKILSINRYRLRKKLSGQQRSELSKIEANFRYNCTGKKKWAIKNYDLLGPFIHLILNFPVCPEHCIFAGQDRQDFKYKKAIANMFENIFGNHGEFQLGIYFKRHPSFKDDRNASSHWHVILSRFRFRHSDIEVYRELNNAFPDLPAGLRALYLMDNPITKRSKELEAIILPYWCRVIHDLSGVPFHFFEKAGYLSDNKAPGSDASNTACNLSLVDVRAKLGQTTMDRFWITEYVVNAALHVFRRIRPSAGPKGYVKIFHLNNDGKESPPHLLEAHDFIERYLLYPNRSSFTQWRPRGFMYPTATFHKSAQALRRLGIVDEASGDINRVIDLPILTIGNYARDLRRAIAGNNVEKMDDISKRFVYFKEPQNEYVRRRAEREKRFGKSTTQFGSSKMKFFRPGNRVKNRR